MKRPASEVGRTVAAALALAGALALCGASGPEANPWPWARPDTGLARPAWPWGPPDADEPGLDAAGPPDTGPVGPCAAFQARLDRRKAWLAARREEQFARGGPPNPKRGILNAVHLFCEAHPADEDCALPGVVVQARSEELLWNPDAGPDDYEAHVLVMKRSLAECLERHASSPKQ